MGSARSTINRAVRHIPETPTMLIGDSAANDFKLHRGYKMEEVTPRSRACLEAKTPLIPADFASMDSMSPSKMENVRAVPNGVKKQHSDTIQAESFPTSFSHA